MTLTTTGARGSPAQNGSALLAFVLAIASFVVGAALLFQAGSWWNARSYVPVEAKMVASRIQFSTSRGRSSSSRVAGVQVDYKYRYRGRVFGGRDISPGGGLDNTSRFRMDEEGPQQSITVWVDPERPQTSLLSRDFKWGTALMTFVSAAVAGAIALFLHGFDSGRMLPASDTQVPADRGRASYLAWYAAWWNLLALTLFLPAVAEAVHGIEWMHIAALLLAAGGVGLSRKAWRMLEQRWLIGAVRLERLADPRIPFKARVHFNPGLGTRFAAPGSSVGVRIEISQVHHVKRGAKELRETVWREEQGEVALPQGAVAIEIEARAPRWRQGRYDDHPIYWKVVMHVHGITLQFRLKPQRQSC
jgi:hypothetical protein